VHHFSQHLSNARRQFLFNADGINFNTKSLEASIGTV